MLHKIELKGKDNPVFADLLLDGEEVKGVMGVEFSQFAGELPTATIYLTGMTNFSTMSDVKYVAYRGDVDNATKYLKESIEKDEALHDVFKSRILSAIDELGVSFDCEELAEKILDFMFVVDAK